MIKNIAVNVGINLGSDEKEKDSLIDKFLVRDRARYVESRKVCPHVDCKNVVESSNELNGPRQGDALILDMCDHQMDGSKTEVSTDGWTEVVGRKSKTKFPK